MLRANVGLVQKISRDYQSCGYSVNIEGEIPFTSDDAEAVLEKVSELFHLAEEALNREIERDQGDQAIGRREEQSPQVTQQSVTSTPAPTPSKPIGINLDSATPKQIKYLHSLSKRQGLSREDLDKFIFDIVRRPSRTGDLTKKEAGLIIDRLNNLNAKVPQ